MKLKSIDIDNFKCFEQLHIDFHPQMNILMGVNGTGKTTIQEALRVAIGTLYIGLDKYEDKIVMPGIVSDDIRLQHLEPQLPTSVETTAEIDDFSLNDGSIADIKWKRTVETLGGKTLYREAKEMQIKSKAMQKMVRNGAQRNIPLLAYFSTDRYKKERRDTNIEPNGSRLRGYFNALDATTNIKFFLNLFYTETLDELQNGKPSELLRAVTQTVSKCVNCKSLKFSIKNNSLLLEQHSGEPIPFHLLSDGVRCILAMVMEIAFRCYLLNPHLGENASKLTKGVVLIDEIDLHLHPSWQLHVLNDLRKAFPNLQFIVSTHAPLIVSKLTNCRIFSISNGEVFDFPNQLGRDANYILQQMNVRYEDSENQELLDEYFKEIEQGRGRTEKNLLLRKRLNDLLGLEHAELKRADLFLSLF